MKRKLRVALMAFLVLFILACGSSVAATPTPNLEATMGAAVAMTKAAQQAAAPAQPVQPQVDLQATVDAQVQLTMAAQQAAQQAPEQPAPEQPVPEQPPAQPEPTQPSGDMAATQQAQPMYDFISTMVDKANLWSAEGVYHDFGSLDKRDSDPSDAYSFTYYQTDNQDYDSFVIRTTITWRAPNSGDPTDLGCGFLWAYSGENNWHATHLDLEGTVHTYRQRGSSENIEMQGGKYPGGLGALSGEAEMVIVVEDDLYTVFINNMQVVRFKDPYIATGKVAPAIFYGNSVGAMHCKMDQIDFWELK
jgi:hypothetical protein